MATATALEAIQLYMKMDDITFKAHLTDLKAQKRLGHSLSPEGESLVHHLPETPKSRAGEMRPNGTMQSEVSCSSAKLGKLGKYIVIKSGFELAIVLVLLAGLSARV